MLWRIILVSTDIETASIGPNLTVKIIRNAHINSGSLCGRGAQNMVVSPEYPVRRLQFGLAQGAISQPYEVAAFVQGRRRLDGGRDLGVGDGRLPVAVEVLRNELWISAARQK